MHRRSGCVPFGKFTFNLTRVFTLGHSGLLSTYADLPLPTAATRTVMSSSSRPSFRVSCALSVSHVTFEAHADFLDFVFLLCATAYNYHLQNFHGISALTGLPFTPPSKFRTESRPNAKPKERRQIIQGLCHSCNKYIDIQGPKETEVKVAEIYWWKHAQACHRSGNKVPDGVGGYFVENKWYERVCAVLGLLGGFEGELRRLLSGSK